MKTSRLISAIFLSAVVVLAISACKKNTLDAACDGSDITFNNYVGELVATKCSGGSCHSSGSGNGVYTTYANMQGIINNGQFKSEVLDKQTMPESTSLSQDQLNKIQCWVDNGYPEN